MTERKTDREPRHGEVYSLALAGVVHDVNQMLAVITGRVGLLLQTGDDPSLRHHLEAIQLAANDAAAMLHRLDPRPVDVSPEASAVVLRMVAAQALGLVVSRAENGAETLNRVPVELCSAVPGQVLREVLTNLLLNALAVTPVGGQIIVSGANTKAGWLELWVEDTGPGLPNGDSEHIFTCGVSNSGVSGRGIGLAACRQLIEQVGGTLTARGRSAGGAVFVLSIPAAADGVDVVVSTENLGPVPSIDVLVVDDEAVVREMLQDVLTAWGCRVHAFRDGATALAEYAIGTATLALLDHNLRGGSGRELAADLRRSDVDLYIVLMSGWQQADMKNSSSAGEVDDYVTKPLSLSELASFVRLANDRSAAG